LIQNGPVLRRQDESQVRSDHLEELLVRLINVLPLALFAVSTATLAMAQSTSAVVSGLVLDPTGRPIPGADVIMVNDPTGLRYSGATNNEGIYTIPNLPPGPYRLQVAKAGFKTLIKPDIVLRTQDALAVNFTLPVGATSETVTIEGGVSILQTESPAVSTVIDRKFVANLPLNGRSFQELILLTPGVATQSPQSNSTTGYNGDFTVNGQRTESNYYTVDGVSANTGAGDGTGLAGPGTSGNLPANSALGTTQSLVSVDALEEFRVQSSTYSAQFGRTPGGQFSFVSRSGTNDLHGTAFDYLRNDFFDANNWFNDYFHLAEPALRQNDFGATLGGPVLVPPVYRGHGRTCFFLSYEGLRLTSPQNATLEFVPSLSLRQSAARVLQPVLNAFPQPTAGGTDYGDGLASFSQAFSLPSHINATSVRLDQDFRGKLRLFFRFGDSPSAMGRRTLSSAGKSTGGLQSYTLGASSQLHPNIEDEFRVGYTRSEAGLNFALDQFGGAQPINLTSSLGASGNQNAFSYFDLFFPGVGSTALLTENASNLSRQWNITDTLSVSAGRHHLMTGLDYRRIDSPLNPVTPTLEFIYISANSLEANQADVALIAKDNAADPIFDESALFLEDEWRIRPLLTISAGMRWEVNPPPGAGSGGRPYTVLGNVYQPSTLRLAPQGTQLWRTSWYNFAPRLGLAWLVHNRPGAETVVRGGGGVFFDTGNKEAASAFTGLGFHASTIQTSVPIPVTQDQLSIETTAVPPYAAIYVSEPHLQLPYTIEWNLSIEQSLGENQALTLSYVGASGRRLLEQDELSIASLNPSFTSIVFNHNGHGSSYHSLQAQFQRRIRGGLQALGSYAWSHSLDFGSTDIALPYRRGNSDFDLRHNFAAALSWDLPGERAVGCRALVLSHWGIDGRVMARTAFPVILNGNLLTDAVTGSQYYGGVDLVSGQPVYLDGSGYPGGRVLNRSAFDAPPGAQVGDAPRNFVRGFGAFQANTAVRREFPLRDQWKLQFRAEAFNVFNHPIFGQIDPTLSDLQFGQAVQTLNQSLATMSSLYQQGGSRSLQFALKLLF
jgi:hypothetical protein